MLHVLGAGAIGLFHAHHFAKRFPRQVILLKRKSLVKNTQITLHTVDGKVEHSECLVEVIGQSMEPIHNLLVCTRAYDTMEALDSVKNRIRNATIFLLMNGVLQVKKELQLKTCLGLTTHGVKRNDEFEISHTGFGETWLETTFMSDQLRNAWSDISFHDTTKNEMNRRALLKMAINSCINPLAALLECKNGHVNTPETLLLVEQISKEICSVIDLPHQELLKHVYQVAQNTRFNTNSMLVDVKNYNRTEIDYLNEYFYNLGVGKGISMPMNQFLIQLIRAKLPIREYRL